MSKIQVTQQQRDNLLDALNVMWPSVPPENVASDLGTFVGDDFEGTLNCGSVACFGGWCAVWPNFKKQGIVLRSFGYPISEKTGDYGLEVAGELFGDDIFNVRGEHKADTAFRGSDHELVTHRLQWLLENSEVAE